MSRETMTREKMTTRRQLTYAVVACLAAAALALFAASRTWRVEVRPRPAPLPAVSTPLSGGDLVPALPALALVALAGAGGLVATRGRGRPVVGAVLVAAGAGQAVAALTAVAEGGVWAGLCVGAGAVVASVGALTVRRGRSWPGLGSSYEPPGAPVHDGTPQAPADRPPDQEADMWDAIDRRIDPTSDNTSQVSG